MHEKIIRYLIGKVMGNKSLNLEKYLDLWIEFESLLVKKEMKLPTFAKNWDKIDFDRYQNKENPEEVFLDKLKKIKIPLHKYVVILYYR